MSFGTSRASKRSDRPDNQPLLWTGPRRGCALFYFLARPARRVAGHRASSVMLHKKQSVSRQIMRALFVWMLGITGCAIYALFFSSAIEADTATRVFLLVALAIGWLYFAKALREWRSVRRSGTAA
jgi:hypothetical protein